MYCIKKQKTKIIIYKKTEKNKSTAIIRTHICTFNFFFYFLNFYCCFISSTKTKTIETLHHQHNIVTVFGYCSLLCIKMILLVSGMQHTYTSAIGKCVFVCVFVCLLVFIYHLFLIF